MSKTVKQDLYTPESSPKNHIELLRIAKKELKKAPKEKYKMKVFLPSGKCFGEFRASTEKKLKNSKTTFGQSYKDHVFTYGEIKPIKVK